MRKILTIAWSGLVIMGRDRKALIMFLLMPMILIGILGVSLKDLMTEGKIEPFAIIVVNQDQVVRMEQHPGAPGGHAPVELGKVLVDDILLSDDVKEVITAEISTDLTAAKERVQNGEAVAVVHIPASFSADVLASKSAQINLYTDPARPTQADIVNQIVRSFTDQVTSSAVASSLLGSQATQNQVAMPEIKQSQSGTRSVGAMQYYAAAMAVMYMLMSAIVRSKSILQGRADGTIARMAISPTPQWIILAGQSLGSALLIAAQFTILLVGTTFIYGVDWGDWVPVLLIGYSFTIAAAGISTGLAAIFREPKAADSAVGLLGMLFGALSGSMFPLYIFPDSLRMVAKLIPNYWALQGFLDQMAGVGLSYAWTPAAILCLIGLAAGALGSVRLATR